jgi:hypothetical protein
MGLTQVQAQAHLDIWLAADLAVATGQSYQYGDRMLTRANASEIRENINFWESKVNQLSSGGIAVIGVTPID